MNPDQLRHITDRALLRSGGGDYLAAALQGVAELAEAYAAEVFLAAEPTLARMGRADRRRLEKTLRQSGGDELGGLVEEEFTGNMSEELRPYQIAALAHVGAQRFRARLNVLFASGHSGGSA